MVRIDFDHVDSTYGVWTASHKRADAPTKEFMSSASIIDLSKCLIEPANISQAATQEDSEVQLSQAATQADSDIQPGKGQIVAINQDVQEEKLDDVHVELAIQLDSEVQPELEQEVAVSNQDAQEEMVEAQAEPAAQDDSHMQDKMEQAGTIMKASSKDCCWQGILELFWGAQSHTTMPATTRTTTDPDVESGMVPATDPESDLERALKESAAMYEEKENSVAQARGRLQSVMDMYHVKASPIQADGNCQFRALAQQLYGDEGKHNEIRAAVVHQLEAAPECYKDFVHEDYTEYLQRMGRDGVWGDNVTLQAASDALASNVHILTDQPGAEYLEVRSNAKMAGGTHKSLWLTFLAEMHYDAVLPL